MSPDFARVLMQFNRRAIGHSSKEEQAESVTHPPHYRQNEGFTPILAKLSAKTRRVLSSERTHLIKDPCDEFYNERRFHNVISNILVDEAISMVAAGIHPLQVSLSQKGEESRLGPDPTSYAHH